MSLAEVQQLKESVKVSHPSGTYKTGLCKKWEETGSCDYGDKCQYAHGFEELRVRKCNTKRKTELCQKWEEFGSCPYGEKCQYAHGEGELQKREMGQYYKTKMCYTYHYVDPIGFCPYGKKCTFLHEHDEDVPNNFVAVKNVEEKIKAPVPSRPQNGLGLPKSLDDKVEVTDLDEQMVVDGICYRIVKKTIITRERDQ